MKNNRRKFFRVLAYTTYAGTGLVMPSILHRDDRVEAQAAGLIRVGVQIYRVAVQVNEVIAVVNTTLKLINETGTLASGAIHLFFGDASKAIAPSSNSFSVASKQLERFQGESDISQLPPGFQGQNYHSFTNVRPGVSRYPCRPFPIEVGSGQKWMFAQSAVGYSPKYRFSCH